MAESDEAPLAQARERAIEELSRHFSNDVLSMEELESRLERVYRARNSTEIAALTRDLGTIPPARRDSAAGTAPPSRAMEPVPDRDRIVGVLSNTKRRGMWAVPRRLEISAILSDMKLDFTQAVLPPTVEIDLTAVLASVRLTIPPGVRIVNRAMVALAEFDDASDADPIAPGDTVIKVTGSVILAEVKVRPPRGR